MRTLTRFAALLLLLPTAAAEPQPTPVTGAWASGNSIDACDTAPITLFMRDGVVAVFLSKDGALHSLGRWTNDREHLSMTHNDFPLAGDGVSNDPVTLKIIELSDTRFITQNAERVVRERIRCPAIEITMGEEHESH